MKLLIVSDSRFVFPPAVISFFRVPTRRIHLNNCLSGRVNLAVATSINQNLCHRDLQACVSARARVVLQPRASTPRRHFLVPPNCTFLSTFSHFSLFIYCINILLPKQAIPQRFFAYGRIRLEFSTSERTCAVLERCSPRGSIIW